MTNERRISKLYLMVHPTPRTEEKINVFFPRWESFFEEAARDPKAAVCVLSNSPPRMAELSATIERLFGDRCFLDTRDWTDATKLKYVDHVCRTFGGHGKRCNAYGLWTDRLALMWAEGLKADMASRGFVWSPDELQVCGFGSQWGGCMTKYVSLMSAYLGVAKTPEILPELCRDAGYGLKGEYLEKKLLDRHVWAFLFRTDKGIHFAHFMESLRPVWERPKVVTIAADPKDYHFNVQAANNQAMFYAGDRDPIVFGEGCATFAVMDGYFSPNVTVIAPESEYEAFRAAMFAAQVGDADPHAYQQVTFGSFPHQQQVELGFFH